MADYHHWLRCCACGDKGKGALRLVSYSGGDWGRWNDSVGNFIDEHVKCHGDNVYSVDPDYKFFEIVTPRMASNEGWWPADAEAEKVA